MLFYDLFQINYLEYLGIFISLLILLAIPILDTSRVRGIQFRGISQFFFGTFLVSFFLLIFVGSQHVTPVFEIIGALATIYYFAYFIIIVPIVGIIENTLIDIALDKTNLKLISIPYRLII